MSAQQLLVILHYFRP